MAPFALRRHVGSNRKDVHDMRNPSIWVLCTICYIFMPRIV